MTVESILEAALRLDPAERLELMDALVATLDGEVAFEFDAAFTAELDRRWRAYEAGQAKTYTWQELKALLQEDRQPA